MGRISSAISVGGLALTLFACGPEPTSHHTAGSSDVGKSTSAVTAGRCPAGTTVLGVDVSEYQGVVDWRAARGAGVNFGVARIGDGYYLDPTFARNWTDLQAAGLIRGAYQYFEPGEDAVAQANIVVNKVGTLGWGDLPVMLDVETTGGQSAATIVAKIHQWVDTVRAGTGRDPYIYTGAYFWDDNVGSGEFTDLALNVAWYGTNCPGTPNAWPYWSFHQFTSSGSVAGIPGPVDLDVWNGDLAHLMKFAGEEGYQVYGAIGAHYQALGGANSFLGAPTSNETSTVCGGGRYNNFEHGAITWTPTVGAWATTGGIRAKWASLGYECGYLGFPTTDELSTQCGGGRYNNFEHGAITWTPSAGAHTTIGGIRAKWASLGYECGALGFPTTDEFDWNGGRRQNFEQGHYIFWDGQRATAY